VGKQGIAPGQKTPRGPVDKAGKLVYPPARPKVIVIRLPRNAK